MMSITINLIPAKPFLLKNSLPLSLAILSLSYSLPSYAETSSFPVYGIVLASIASVSLGELDGNSIKESFTSPTRKHQVSLFQGQQDSELNITRIAYRWENELPIWKSTHWMLSSTFETSYGYWQLPNRYHPSQNQDIGLTPLFKWTSQAMPSWYAEVGVGVHLLENIQVRNDNKSTQFQFGDQFGLGWENDYLRIGYRYLHISNANIQVPNPATDFHSIELGYRF